MRDTFLEAINSLLPNAKFHGMSGHEKAEDNTIVEWFDSRKQPSVAEIQAEMDRLQPIYESQAYARTRQPLYPDIGDQLDDLYKEGAFSSAMAAKIKKVKDDNPKG